MSEDKSVQSLSREELFDLYKFFDTSTKDELNFFFQYLHFYIGLLSAIMGATLAGLLDIPANDLRGLILLIGPALILILSHVGYNNVQAFYRRFTESWVTKFNIESMLNLHKGKPVEKGIQKPIYASRRGGFIPEIEWKSLKAVFNEAEKNKSSGEEVAQKLVGVGSTLVYANWTFKAFSTTAILLTIANIAIVFL